MKDFIIESDKPIKTKEEDRLRLYQFANHIANAIVNIPEGENCTVSLEGRWGSGKSSTVNMVKTRLKELDEKLIIIDFDTWNILDSQKLIEDFFYLLINEFYKMENYKKMAINMLSYLEELCTILSPLKKAISESGKYDKNLNKTKENIVEAMKKAPKILIIIDNMDRLQNEQIKKVFQLISSVADFPNVIYLLPFDKDVILKALSETNSGNEEAYLEKIIQMPIKLPTENTKDLRSILLKEIKKFMAKEGVNESEKVGIVKAIDTCIIDNIKTVRDVKRLYNTTRFYYLGFEKEINFTDALLLMNLSLFMESTYKKIENNKALLVSNINVKEELIYKDVILKERIDFEKIFLTGDKSEEEKFLIKKKLGYLFPKIYALYIEELKNFNRIAFRKDMQKGISNSNRFDDYFINKFSKVTSKDYRLKETMDEILYSLDELELEKFLTELSKESLLDEFLIEAKENIDVEKMKINRAIIFFRIFLEAIEKSEFNNYYNIKQGEINSPIYGETLQEIWAMFKTEDLFEIIKGIFISDNSFLSQTILLNLPGKILENDNGDSKCFKEFLEFMYMLK